MVRYGLLKLAHFLLGLSDAVTFPVESATSRSRRGDVINNLRFVGSC
jgi:hypothetical protein